MRKIILLAACLVLPIETFAVEAVPILKLIKLEKNGKVNFKQRAMRTGELMGIGEGANVLEGTAVFKMGDGNYLKAYKGAKFYTLAAVSTGWFSGDSARLALESGSIRIFLDSLSEKQVVTVQKGVSRIRIDHKLNPKGSVEMVLVGEPGSLFLEVGNGVVAWEKEFGKPGPGDTLMKAGEKLMRKGSGPLEPWPITQYVPYDAMSWMDAQKFDREARDENMKVTSKEAMADLAERAAKITRAPEEGPMEEMVAAPTLAPGEKPANLKYAEMGTSQHIARSRALSAAELDQALLEIAEEKKTASAGDQKRLDMVEKMYQHARKKLGK